MFKSVKNHLLKSDGLALQLILAGMLAVSLVFADTKIIFGPAVLRYPELLVYLITLLVLVTGSTRRDFINSVKSLDKDVRLALLLVLAGSLIGVIVSPVHKRALGGFESWVLAPILLYLLMTAFTKNRRVVITLVTVLGLGLIAKAGVSMLSLGVGERLSAYYESPNYFTALVAPIFVVFLWFGQNKKGWPYLVLAVKLLGLIILAKSFGALLGIAVAALVIWLYQPKRLKIITATIAVVVIALMAPKFIERFGTTNNSMDNRLQIWSSAAYMISDRPLSGVGIGGFEDYYPSYVVDRVTKTPLQWDAAQPHNLALAVWLALGICGLVGFVYILFRSLRWSNRPDAYQLALIVILAHGLFDTPYFRADLSMMFWFYLAASAIMKRQEAA